MNNEISVKIFEGSQLEAQITDWLAEIGLTPADIIEIKQSGGDRFATISIWYITPSVTEELPKNEPPFNAKPGSKYGVYGG